MDILREFKEKASTVGIRQFIIQTHFHNLRSKIEPDPAKPIYLKNVWGKGYIFRPEGEKEA